jgi:hypothetical protein
MYRDNCPSPFPLCSSISFQSISLLLYGCVYYNCDAARVGARCGSAAFLKDKCGGRGGCGRGWAVEHIQAAVLREFQVGSGADHAEPALVGEPEFPARVEPVVVAPLAAERALPAHLQEVVWVLSRMVANNLALGRYGAAE